MELFFTEPGMKVCGSIPGISYNVSSPQMLAAIKHVTDDSFVFWYDSTLVHNAHNTVELLQRETSTSFFWAQQPRTEIHSLQDLDGHAAMYELQVNKIEEIKYQLVKLWQNSNTAFNWKDVFMFCQKH